MTISHCYWHLVVKNDNFTLLLTSSGQEWEFHIATDISLVLCKAKRPLWWPHLNIWEFKFGRWTFFGQWTPLLVPEQKCLEYQYTKLGRWTYFGDGPHWYQSGNAYNTSTQKLADEPTLANGPRSTRVEMPWIPVHKTWQMNLLWPMDPPGTRAEMPWIPLHKTWQMSLLWPMDPKYQSRDALHTCTHNLADEPTLANGPPSTRGEMTCIPLHKTWQMNLLWLNTMAKVWKL